MSKSRRIHVVFPITEEERIGFLSKVYVDQGSGCHVWTRCIDTGGYGSAWFRKRLWRAHRVSWMISFGEIPEDMFVLHKCDNRACVNPDHLFLGNHAANMADMKNKGRCIEDHHTGRLKRDQVIEIKRRTIQCGDHPRVVAADFGVHETTVYNIMSGRRWSHIKLEGQL